MHHKFALVIQKRILTLVEKYIFALFSYNFHFESRKNVDITVSL